MTILYHKNCPDGLAAAYVAYTKYEEKAKAIPISYDDDIKKLTEDRTLLFVDFCPKVDWLLENAKDYEHITIIDHHEINVTPVLDKASSLPNVTIHFDNAESGATLTYKVLYNTDDIPIGLKYIKDRDLWLWELPNSREFSEGFKALVNINDLTSFAEFTKIPIEEVIVTGKVLFEATNKRVDNRLQSAVPITINGVDLICLNATTDISELGNALCTEYNLPSATYQISPDNTVWWSFRSLNTLPPVNTLAVSLGGGGHRNAAGATTDLKYLMKTLKG